MSPKNKLCKFTDCAKGAVAKGLCDTHRKQKSRSGNLTTINSYRQSPTCAVKDCDKPSRGRSLCNSHYLVWRKYAFTQDESERCSEKGCFGIHYAKGFCSPHYTLNRALDKRISEYMQGVAALVK